MNTEYKCPKCSYVSLSFTSLCHHVQYDHELWYLGKSHSALSSSNLHSSITIVPSNENNKINRDSTAVKQLLDIPVKVPVLSVSSQDVMKQALIKQLEEQEKNLYETRTKLEEEVLEKYKIQRDMQALVQKYDFLQNEVNRLHIELVRKDKIANHNVSSTQDVPLQNLQHHSGRHPFLDSRSEKLPFSATSTPINFVKARNMRNSGLPAVGACDVTCLHKVHSDSCLSCATGSLNKFVNKTKFDQQYRPNCVLDQVGYSTADQHHEGINKNYIAVSDSYTSQGTPYFSIPTQHNLIFSGHPSNPSSVTSQPLSNVTVNQKFPLHLSQTNRKSASQISQTDSGKGDSVIATRSQDDNMKADDGEDVHQVFRLVFYYLDTESLLTCRAVCSHWKQVIEQPQYWISVQLSHLYVTPELLHIMSQWCTATQSLTIQAVKIPQQQTDKPLSQVLHATRGLLESGLEALLRSSQQTLTTLSIVSCGNLFTERSLWLVSCYCHRLTRFAYFSQYYPATPEALWSLGSGCRKLHTLIIPPLYPSLQPERFSNRCLLMIAKCWSHLRVLCIGGTEVEVSGIAAIVHHCQKLEILELDHMGEIQEHVAVAICKEGLQKLQKFYFTHTPIIPSAIKHICAVCPNLEVIGIILGPMDYFVHPDYSPNKEEYSHKVKQLKDLMDEPNLKNILQIKVQLSEL